MGAFSWLRGGNDGELAKEQYSGQESASAQAARTRRASHHRRATAADRRGQAWEEKDRKTSGDVVTDWTAD